MKRMHRQSMEHCVYGRVINVSKSVGLINVKISLDVLTCIVSIKQTSVLMYRNA